MQFSYSDEFLLRRLSTPSYIQEPGNVLSTKWVWYWEDDNGWKKYAKTEVDTIILLLLFKTKTFKIVILSRDLFAEFTSYLSIGKESAH